MVYLTFKWTIYKTAFSFGLRFFVVVFVQFSCNLYKFCLLLVLLNLFGFSFRSRKRIANLLSFSFSLTKISLHMKVNQSHF